MRSSEVAKGNSCMHGFAERTGGMPSAGERIGMWREGLQTLLATDTRR